MTVAIVLKEALDEIHWVLPRWHSGKRIRLPVQEI